MLGSGSEAEDAVQETMIRAWRAIDGFEGRSSLRSWLYRIANNVCVDMVRSPQRRARPMDLGPSTPVAEAKAVNTRPEHAFVQPVTILAALVLSIPGAILALFVSRTDLSMPSMIGMVMLMGIATKNSILLVDYVVMARRDHGLSRWDALLDACSKRARPIVMTTIAMIGGMLPSAYGLGSGGEFRAPMAIAVIGGLMSSTLLSLVFVPAVFAVMDDIAALTWRLFARFVGPTEEPSAPGQAGEPRGQSLPAPAE